MIVYRKVLICFAVAWTMVCLESAAVQAQYLRVRDICRIKGQEENTLQGEGLVIGLKGTGDSDPATLRLMAKIMERVGNPLSPTLKAQSPLDELKNVKNAARVMVTATIPAEGVRQGEQVTCTVSALSAKSLQGGILLMTSLLGPNRTDDRIFATAQGPLTLPDSGHPTVAVVHDGCRLEIDVATKFDDGDYVTLVIDRHHAGFPAAYEIQEALNSQGGKRRLAEGTAGPVAGRRADSENIAEARDALNVEVRIPEFYTKHRVEFINLLLDTQITLSSPTRVVINERNGVIIVGDNVSIGRVAVSHKNITVHIGDDTGRGPLFVVDQSADSSTTRLKALVDALNALKVDPQSIIDIIKSLERSGNLFGQLIVE